MTTTQTPPLEDDAKPIRDALALGPTLGQWSVDGHFGEWGIASDHSVDGAACKSGRQFVAACFRVSKKDTPKYAAMFEATARYIAAANPERLTRLLAHIDAQAVRLEAAERDASERAKAQATRLCDDFERLGAINRSKWVSTNHGKWEGMAIAYEQAAIKCRRALGHLLVSDQREQNGVGE